MLKRKTVSTSEASKDSGEGGNAEVDGGDEDGDDEGEAEVTQVFNVDYDERETGKLTKKKIKNIAQLLASANSLGSGSGGEAAAGGSDVAGGSEDQGSGESAGEGIDLLTQK